MKVKFIIIFCMFLISSIAWSQPQNNQQQKRQPPPEAISACNNMSDGDSCSFKAPDGKTISGTCVKKDNQSFCVPKDHPGGPQRGSSMQGGMQGQHQNGNSTQGGMQGNQQQRRQPPPEAISACNSMSDGDACSFKAPDGKTISGTCVKKDNQSFCVPKDHPGQKR